MFRLSHHPMISLTVRLMTKAVFLLSVLLCTLQAGTFAQILPLPSDVEYYGALLDSTKQTIFDNGGNLSAAFLKSDYPRGQMVFQAGTEIKFSPSGTVVQATLKNIVDVEGLKFLPGRINFFPDGTVLSGKAKAGSTDANLVLPVDSDVNLNAYGKIASIENLGTYRLFNMTLTRTTTVVYSAKDEAYLLSGGFAGQPQLVAVIPTVRTEANVSGALPLIMPQNSQFRFTRSGQEINEEWFHPAKLIFNSYDFGMNPIVRIKGGKLVGITVLQNVTLDNRTYYAQSTVRLDGKGKVMPPY